MRFSTVLFALPIVGHPTIPARSVLFQTFLVNGLAGPVLEAEALVLGQTHLLLLLAVLLMICAAASWLAYLQRAVHRHTEDLRRQLIEAERLHEEADQASRCKSAFLANMSHEIRTPMSGVLGMIDLVLETHLTPEQYEYLDLARISAHSLLDVVGDILDFSKIEAGKLELSMVTFALPLLVESTTRAFASQAEAKHLRLECRVVPDLPVMVVGDSARLRQVLVNLIGNALKFTSSGEIVVEAKRGALFAERQTLLFSVQDSGIGIAHEKQRSIFDAFAQLDSSTAKKYGGTGLGLAISSRMVELMGGKLSLRSEPGSGSTFSFTIEVGLLADCPADKFQDKELTGEVSS